MMFFCAVSVFSQKTSNIDFSKLPLNGKFPQNDELRNKQCEEFASKDFVGETINVNVFNTELSDILEYITDYYGLKFIVDRSVRTESITVNISNTPWNILLNKILDAQDLGIQINCPYLRIANKETILQEKDGKIIDRPIGGPQENKTETIELKNISLCINKIEPKKKSILFRNFHKIISRRLTWKGKVEIDKSNYLITITDHPENLKTLEKTYLLS